MERLTWKAPNGTYQIDDCLADSSPVSRTTCYDENFKNAFSIYEGSAIDKLGAYEDLEEQLESAYGECEGFLKTSVEHLVNLARQEEIQEEIGQPHKARLLTDEDADEWLEYKRLKEQGRLKILPCEVGDVVYFVDLYRIHSRKNYLTCVIDEFAVSRNECYAVLTATETSFPLRRFKAVNIKYFGEVVFLTKEEAEQTLERRKNG